MQKAREKIRPPKGGQNLVKVLAICHLHIKKGETANNVTNRVLSYDLDSEDPMYVRVIPEFTNERKARSDEEMLKFNGRYVVYQVELKARNLPKYYKGEW